MMTKAMAQVRCEACRMILDVSAILTALNPFSSSETVQGCPHCFAIDHFTVVCDEAGCEQDVSCGWPSADSYRMTCHDHSCWAKD